MTPRQEIRPVPYALSLRPGAVIIGDAGANPSLKVMNTGANLAALVATTTGTNSPALYASAQGTGSPAVYALSPNDIGVSGSGKTGGYFSTNSAGTPSSPNVGVDISTQFSNTRGIRVTASGDSSMGIEAKSTGLYSVGVEGLSSKGIGVFGSSAQDVGVKGIGKTGGYFSTNAGGSDWNHLVRAVDVSTTFDYNPGINIKTSGLGSQGVWAITTGYDSAAVSLETTGDHSNGASLKTSGKNSVGIFSVTHSDTAYAVDAETHGPNSIGVDASTIGQNSPGIRSNTKGPNSRGLYVVTEGETSPGVVAHTFRDYSEGVYSVTDGVYSHGVYVKVQGSSSQGVNASSAQATAVWADTGRADHMYGVQTPDYMRAARYDTGSSDVAEYWPVTGDVTPGTVLVLGDGGILHESTQANDTRVAGIVSTDPGMSLGTRDGGNPGEQLIALAGRVPCRVDASSAPIQSGDLLTTSDIPGHAMKATDPKIGTVLGKAAGSLESGTGTIDVLVTLQ